MSDKKISILPEIPKSIDNAVENLTDLPTKGIGQTLADCWYLVFGGISHSADKKRIKYAIDLENFKNELQTSISSVPESIRKEPSSQIVLAALDNAKYCIEEKELRDLFTALLTSSVDSTQTVHPSFAHIISRMSPIDAQMMKYLICQPYLPLCDILRVSSRVNGADVLATNVFVDGPDTLTCEEKSLSISSLLSVGLIEIPEGMYFNSDSSYLKFYESEQYLSLLSSNTRQELQLEKKLIRLSSLGKSFASCCITNRVYSISN